MEWYSGLYYGEKAEKKKENLIQKIESGKTPVNIYLLTLPAGDRNQLEILPAWDMKFWCENMECPMIVGLACGKREALGLVQRITEDVLRRTGDVKLREYFQKESNYREPSGKTV